MAFRFRRSVKVLPGVRLNLGKTGISTSVGVRGASMTFGKNGTYVNTGLPGTGMSYRTKVGGGSKQRASNIQGNASSHFAVSLMSVKSTAMTIAMVGLIFGVVSLFIFPFIHSGLLALSFLSIFIACVAGAGSIFTRPGKALARIRKARKLMNSGNAELAMDSLIKADYWHPTPQIKYDIELLAARLGDHSKVIQYSESNQDKLIEDFVRLGHSYIATENYLKAKECFDAIINEVDELNQPSIKEGLYFRYGYVLYKNEMEDEAVPYLQKVSPENEDYQKAIKLIGACFFNKGKYDLVVEKLGPYVRNRKLLNQDATDIAYLLGKAYYQMGEKRKAKTWLTKVYVEDASYKDVEKLLTEINDK